MAQQLRLFRKKEDEMSELINNKQERINKMKTLIRKLHEGKAEPGQVQHQLEALLEEADYSDVFAMEVQLIEEGIKEEEIQRLCDVHTAVLKKQLDRQETPATVPGHPVRTFLAENAQLENEIRSLRSLFQSISEMPNEKDASILMHMINAHFNSLMDVDKHYRRKENLLFPFFEKKEISGPPAVMWGKHDEVREMMKNSIEGLQNAKPISAEEATAFIQFALEPTLAQIEEMIYKEAKILFPMAVETLSDTEWYEIYLQSDEIGFCLIDPKDEWQPKDLQEMPEMTASQGKIKLPSGTFSVEELTKVLNTVPVDMTFVDKDDTVRYFTQGKERIFDRNRTILGRKVQYCHPPSSVHIVEKILQDFKSGKQDEANFWIQIKGQFIYIRYFAMRDENENYLGTLEVSQDLTELRALEGERRILEYDK